MDVGSRCRFNMEERNWRMAFFVKEAGNEADWMRVCNFVLHSLCWDLQLQ